MTVKTQGTDLFYIDPDSEEIVNVGCVTAIDGLDSSIEQIEITCLNSAEREYTSGMGAPGTGTFTINMDPTNSVHARLYELKQAGVTLKWALGWGDGPREPDGTIDEPPSGVDTNGDFILPDTRSWLTFSGYMSSFPMSFTLNSVVTSQIGIQISGRLVLTPKDNA